VHEYCVVRELVRHLCAQLAGRPAAQVTEVRLRRGSEFAEGPLRQAFAAVAEGTPLEGARLVIEEFPVERTCAGCGKRLEVDLEDALERVHVCPACGTARRLEHAEDLEVLGFSTSDPCGAGPA
jgi:Zn finger protein HypA/HybF involved in hydrogenase expression